MLLCVVTLNAAFTGDLRSAEGFHSTEGFLLWRKLLQIIKLLFFPSPSSETALLMAESVFEKAEVALCGFAVNNKPLFSGLNA